MTEAEERELLLVREELRQRQKKAPLQFWLPNVGQEKAFDAFKAAPFPRQLLFSGGNGVGKTVACVALGAGCAWGVEELNPAFFGDFAIFRTLAEIRESREEKILYGRILCAHVSMKKNGALLQRIRRWWPKGLYSMSKEGAKHYTSITCRDRATGLVCCEIDIKTFDQDVEDHAGPDLDFILVDEPPPEDIYLENIARLRAGAFGFIANFLTPLNVTGWMLDQIVHVADGESIVHVQTSAWDNCSDWHPEPAMWSGGAVGQGRVLTRGHVPKTVIDQNVAAWRRSKPLEVEARLNGSFTHLSGSYWKIYSPAVHLIPREACPRIPTDWPLFFAMDPHHGRPPMCAWAIQGPNELIVCAEWPNENYAKLSAGSPSIKEICRTIRDKEGAWEKRIPDENRVGDPNTLAFPYPNSSLTVRQEYGAAGLWMEMGDDNLEVGLQRVNELLFYNHELPVNAFNRPKLRVLSHDLFTGEPMVNIPLALARFGFKQGVIEANKGTSLKSKLDPLYADAADVLRYLVLRASATPFRPVSDYRSDWAIIKGSRAGAVPLVPGYGR